MMKSSKRSTKVNGSQQKSTKSMEEENNESQLFKPIYIYNNSTNYKLCHEYSTIVVGQQVEVADEGKSTRASRRRDGGGRGGK